VGIGFLLGTLCLGRATKAEGWSLQGNAQQKQRAALERLKRDPYEPMAFALLLRLGQTPLQRKRIEERLRAALQRTERHAWPWIVWGRWLKAKKQCNGAVAAFLRAEAYGEKRWQIKALLVQAWSCAGDAMQALQSARQALALAPSRYQYALSKDALLRAMRQRSLRDIEAIHQHLLLKIRGRQQLLALAGDLTAGGYPQLAMALYARLEQLGQRLRGRDWLEKGALALEIGKLDVAKRALKEAQKQQINAWWRWDAYAFEEALARKEGAFSRLYEERKKAWSLDLTKVARAERLRRLLWLARGAVELKRGEEAQALDRQILALDPQAWEPRVRILERAQQRGDQQAALRAVTVLLEQGRADIGHMVYYLREKMKLSGRPLLERWQEIWSLRYRGLPCYHRDTTIWTHFSTRERFGAICYKSSFKDWEEYRQRRWDFWLRYEAKEPHKKAFEEAKAMLLRMLPRFGSHLPSLLVLETWLVEIGEDTHAENWRKKMIGLVGVDAEGFLALEQRFRKMGRWDLWQRLVRGILQQKPPSLLWLGTILHQLRRADQASHVAREMALLDDIQRLLLRIEGVPEELTQQRFTKLGEKAWKGIPCHWLQRALRFSEKEAAAEAEEQSKQARSNEWQGKAAQKLAALWRLLSVAGSCRQEAASWRALQQKLEQQPWSLAAWSILLPIYTQDAQKSSVARLLAKQQPPASAWFSLLQKIFLYDIHPDMSSFLLQYTLQALQGEPLCQALALLCREQAGCGAILPRLEVLFKDVTIPLMKRMELLLSIAPIPASAPLRLATLQAQRSAWKSQPSLRRWLLKHPLLFEDKRAEGSLQEALQSLRQAIREVSELEE
jgi:hypothetical protein